MTPEPDTQTAEETDARHAAKMAKKKAARDKIMATKSGEKASSSSTPAPARASRPPPSA